MRTTEALDPPATSIFTPDTEFGSRFLIEVVRGCGHWAPVEKPEECIELLRRFYERRH